jgi:hypothetical protein
MNILSRIPSPSSVEGAYVWFQMLSLLFLAGTIITGAGTIVTGFIANRRTATALSVQQERAAKAEKDLLALQERIEYRHLTAEQRNTFLATLREGPKGTVRIICPVRYEEPCNFAGEISEVVLESGWRQHNLMATVESVRFFGNVPVGVKIVQREGERLTPEGQSMYEALRRIGLSADIEFKKLLEEPFRNGAHVVPEGAVVVVIGLKP